MAHFKMDLLIGKLNVDLFGGEILAVMVVGTTMVNSVASRHMM